jgi:hypothetical protein
MRLMHSRIQQSGYMERRRLQSDPIVQSYDTHALRSEAVLNGTTGVLQSTLFWARKSAALGYIHDE